MASFQRSSRVRSQRPMRPRPQLETLEDRMLLSSTILEVEPNNTKAGANAFSFPGDGVAILRGISRNHDDRDFFRFTAPATTSLHVNVRAVNGVFAQLEIQRPGGIDVFETEPNDGVNSGVAQLQAGQTYFVRLRAKGGAAAEYAVRLTLNGQGGGGGAGGGGGGALPSVVAESESNDSKALADAFAFNAAGAAQLTGRSRNHDDKDFFVFTATQTGTVQVSVTATNGVFAQLEVERPSGIDVFETQPNDGVNSGSFAVQEGLKYFVRLRATDNVAAAYRVDLTLA